jgi:hypothetical protein
MVIVGFRKLRRGFKIGSDLSVQVNSCNSSRDYKVSLF